MDEDRFHQKDAFYEAHSPNCSQVLNKQEHACKTSRKVYEAILDNEDSINGMLMVALIF